MKKTAAFERVLIPRLKPNSPCAVESMRPKYRYFWLMASRNSMRLAFTFAVRSRQCAQQ